MAKVSGDYEHTPPTIIHAMGLSKTFTRRAAPQGRLAGLRRMFSRDTTVTTAVRDVSFDIRAGELVGYLGSNGAGKSTTIKMLTGILTPSSGVVEVGGLVPWRDRRRNAMQIGAVFGQRSQLWYDLPLRDSFSCIRDLYGIEDEDYRARLGHFTEMLDMADFLDTPVRFLSLGQRMRGDLTAALLHNPAVVYLDEPTVGLDVLAKRRIREFIAGINRDLGTTVVLTTHDMEDVEVLCRRIIMIDAGTVLFDGTPEDLRHRYACQRQLHVTLSTDTTPADLDLDGVSVTHNGRSVVLTHDPTQVSTPDLISFVIRRWPISDLSVRDASLSDVVENIYSHRQQP